MTQEQLNQVWEQLKSDGVEVRVHRDPLLPDDAPEVQIGRARVNASSVNGDGTEFLALANGEIWERKPGKEEWKPVVRLTGNMRTE